MNETTQAANAIAIWYRGLDGRQRAWLLALYVIGGIVLLGLAIAAAIGGLWPHAATFGALFVEMIKVTK